MDYRKSSGLEAIYLLGGFGVAVYGSVPVLTKLPEKLIVGDITQQGLPFYSGSISYLIDGLDDIKASISVTSFGGSLIKLKGKETTIVAFPPHKGVSDGLNTIEVVLTRRNTFGPLHENTETVYIYSPNNYLTEGDAWTDEYMLIPQGLLKKPVIKRVAT